ncbi:unnamed protein product [Polarella glacialis]|uniref:ubiquitinyl hydrolase 1 n=1 Tax=Polarella glacialis TaxID=89957 RepID=A0A813ESU6_POLGL|nr:unnamed protein product [Polarella glacialis]CAE8637763.1 unnamed protein product [Polarella glacialis]CAE8670042.1 unnamed protein product [Polarella glacialis]CAE8691949.1 unnamed protein product [Polarella glacialis]CAE8708664.1 unnamed protein product [Polarella glacialis]
MCTWHLQRQESGALIFHERGAFLRLQCGLHALNNLFGEEWVDAQAMESLANALPQQELGGDDRLRSIFGAWLGDWDLQVIVAALESRGASIVHHVMASSGEKGYNRMEDRGCLLALKEVEREVRLKSSRQTLLGVIVNSPSQSFWGRAVGGRHWYTVAPRWSSEEAAGGESRWWNLDSKLEEPKSIEAPSADSLPLPFFGQLLDTGCHLFFVADAEIGETVKNPVADADPFDFCTKTTQLSRFHVAFEDKPSDKALRRY